MERQGRRVAHGRRRLVRTALLVAGGLVLALGLLLSVGGLLSLVISVGSMRAPEGVWVLLIGLGLTAAGAILVRSTLLRPAGRLLARGVRPLLRETVEYLGSDPVVCSVCGHANDQDASFCQSCGARIVAECRSCGQRNGSSALFCERCHAPLAHHPVPR